MPRWLLTPSGLELCSHAEVWHRAFPVCFAERRQYLAALNPQAGLFHRWIALAIVALGKSGADMDTLAASTEPPVFGCVGRLAAATLPACRPERAAGFGC